MRQITGCPFCNKQIPDVSVFCPYCGKRIAEAEAKQTPTSHFEVGIQKTLEKVKNQVSSWVINLEKKIEDSDTINYANKQGLLNILNQLQFVDRSELEQQGEDLTEWADKIEQAISGEKCIICLQEFKIKESGKLAVVLCPSCKYAGHPNHFFTWLETKNTCPMCRTKLTKNNLVKGYLELKENQLIFKKA